MKCLDTNILIDILRNKHDAGKIVSELDAESRNATTAVNTLELFYGANHSINKADNIEKVRFLLQRLDVLPLTLRASEPGWGTDGDPSTKRGNHRIQGCDDSGNRSRIGNDISDKKQETFRQDSWDQAGIGDKSKPEGETYSRRDFSPLSHASSTPGKKLSHSKLILLNYHLCC